MIGNILSAVIGTHNDRELKRLRPKVEAINAFEPELSALSDSQLRSKTDEFRKRISRP